ncbi:MAG: zinc metallopeptidase [Clostridia bacterium]|nr:zinc metallopeptidase [Clostridia bacterium]
MFYYSFFDWTYLLLIPALIFALIAQIRVKSAFEQGNRVKTSQGISGARAARKILDDNGLYHISIERVGGHLTDHYDPKAGVIRLSESVYDNTSAAAVGVAAHEAGHAVQYATGYAPIRIRAAIIPVTRFGSMLAGPLFLIGIILSYFYFQAATPIADLFMVTGIALYSFSTIFQLVTLPVEFNASRRALTILEGWGTMTNEEQKTAKSVLSAAALTYVAALATSLLSLLRLILIFGGRRGRR